jgi:DNA-binding response OmpR family regulator
VGRILLVDDSPHAQRMGERILTEEGFEVVTVSNADSALIRMEDVDPDLVIADTVMPGRTGFDICQYLKMSPRHRHVRVVLTAGVTEQLDPALAKRVEADGTLQKPFEASLLISTVRPLVDAAVQARAAQQPSAGASNKPAPKAPAAPFVAVIDGEQVRAAVTVALDASMGALVDEITARVLAALNTKQPAAASTAIGPTPAHAPPVTLPPPEPPKPAPPAPVSVQPVRRVTPVRLRSGSVLGLDMGQSNPEDPK